MSYIISCYMLILNMIFWMECKWLSQVGNQTWSCRLLCTFLSHIIYETNYCESAIISLTIQRIKQCQFERNVSECKSLTKRVNLKNIKLYLSFSWDWGAALVVTRHGCLPTLNFCYLFIASSIGVCFEFCLLSLILAANMD